jgi:hypothetical protein
MGSTINGNHPPRRRSEVIDLIEITECYDGVQCDMLQLETGGFRNDESR